MSPVFLLLAWVIVKRRERSLPLVTWLLNTLSARDSTILRRSCHRLHIVGNIAGSVVYVATNTRLRPRRFLHQRRPCQKATTSVDFVTAGPGSTSSSLLPASTASSFNLRHKISYTTPTVCSNRVSQYASFDRNRSGIFFPKFVLAAVQQYGSIL